MIMRTHSMHRQRGAAILLAMLIVTLVATMAAGMVWMEWRGIEVESAERARSQGEWLLNGALDWARVILKSDARAGNGVDHLGEPWAMPLAESRLSSFLSSDENHADDSGPDAFLSGQITDANARYNLTNLIRSKDGQSGRSELAKLQVLCASLGVPAGVAEKIFAGLGQSWSAVQSLGDDVGQKDASNSLLLPTEVSQLAWYGIDPKVIQQLEPFVIFLPGISKVNVNTASVEVLMAAIPGIGRGGAQAIVDRRAQKPFSDIKDAEKVANYQPPATAANVPQPIVNIDVKSDYFEVVGQLRYEQHVLRERSLVHRVGLSEVDVVRRVRLPPDAS